MTAATGQNPPHLDARPRYGPTPAAAAGGGGRRPAAATSGEVHPCPHGDPGQVPAQPPMPAPRAPEETGAQSAPVDRLARLPEVLTAREAAAILRVGRNQLYQAVARGELGAVRIGRTIRIPKQALLELLAPASPPKRARGDE
jgi:excisionase family DNA binding protein